MEATKNSVTLCQFDQVDVESTWRGIYQHAQDIFEREEHLRPLLRDVVLQRQCIGTALAARLARKLAREEMGRDQLEPILRSVFVDNPKVAMSAVKDMIAIKERDPACESELEPLLFFKGFLAITTYRVAHFLWNQGRRELALYFQSICSEIFSVDIHPAAQIGCGILLDHATSVVIGETAIVEDDVSILHEVTLGGTGKEQGNRHPIVRSGVLIGAGSKLLGRIEIGECAKIGAGSVVLQDVEPRHTVAGVPAVIVGTDSESSPAIDMNQSIDCGKR